MFACLICYLWDACHAGASTHEIVEQVVGEAAVQSVFVMSSSGRKKVSRVAVLVNVFRWTKRKLVRLT